jgi:hypothetical protein
MSAEPNQKPKMGRPAILGGDAKTVTVRISRSQEQAFIKAARKNNQPKTVWMRSVLCEAAEAA